MTRRAARAAGGLAAALLAGAAGCAAPRPYRPLTTVFADAHIHDELELSGVAHVVKRGETLYRVARTYGIDLADLMETNGIADPRDLTIGQELWIPGADRVLEVPVAPAPAPAAPPAAPPGEAAPGRPTPPREERAEARPKVAPPPPPRAEPPPREREREREPERAASREREPDAPRERERVAVRERPAREREREAEPEPVARDAPIGRPPAAFGWPLKGVLYGRFGVRSGRRHDGIDLAAPEGTRVGAAASGDVIYVGEQAGYGRIVILRHAGGMVTLYAHMRRSLVEEGDRVDRGDPIGEVGQTGRTSGPHLHFEVRDGTRPRNPLL
ncbi:MAG TPA: M23 family metallopeptidase, partial [Anaeromyxobacteraceae bacterium]|nr:M23 family metallopeptidase [Anaeromyxobacteraceae bacterium]